MLVVPQMNVHVSVVFEWMSHLSPNIYVSSPKESGMLGESVWDLCQRVCMDFAHNSQHLNLCCRPA